MNRQYLPLVHSLRFRRWSRSGAAAFRSIGREVTIGNLRANVVSRLFRKDTMVPLELASSVFVGGGGLFVVADCTDENALRRVRIPHRCIRCIARGEAAVTSVSIVS